MFGEIFGRSQAQGEDSIQWKTISGADEVGNLIQDSANHPVLVFKHSTRCGTSAMALDRLQRNWQSTDLAPVETYMVDVISQREVSNELADQLGVWHQSPQVLLIHNGSCVYDDSHFGINYEVIKKELANLEVASN